MSGYVTVGSYINSQIGLSPVTVMHENPWAPSNLLMIIFRLSNMYSVPGQHKHNVPTPRRQQLKNIYTISAFSSVPVITCGQDGLRPFSCQIMSQTICMYVFVCICLWKYPLCRVVLPKHETASSSEKNIL